MKAVLLKNLKHDRYFTLYPIEAPKDSQVYVKGEYDRSAKKYMCTKFTDILGSGRMIDGNTVVFIDFYF